MQLQELTHHTLVVVEDQEILEQVQEELVVEEQLEQLEELTLVVVEVVIIIQDHLVIKFQVEQVDQVLLLQEHLQVQELYLQHVVHVLQLHLLMVQL